MRALTLALGLALGAATPALACINDREVDSSEREFRSSYGQPEQAEQAPQQPLVSAGVAGGGLAGLLLLGGALYAVRRRP